MTLFAVLDLVMLAGGIIFALLIYAKNSKFLIFLLGQFEIVLYH